MGKDTELLHAVKVGDVSAIRKFLFKFKSGPKGKKSISKKLNINHPDEDGFTVLHHAALLNNVEVILALIEMEADPNSRDKKGMCPLHMASWAGKDQVVKALLDNRGLVNLPSFGGETPLLLASQHGYANVVEILMKYNADPTIRNNNLESPLDLACQFGHAAVARFLLMRGEVVHMLREKHTDPRYKQPLHLAAKGGHVDVIRLLTESGADINEQSPQGTCLHLAALYGKVEVLKFLIEAGANVRAVNKKDMTPLDMVNQFTTSRAGIEIKQLLREALGERVIFARANSDYVNVYDPTGLSFKTGETITVLEQNEDGRWKGSIVDGQEERVGYFPAKSVSLLSNVKETRSLGSLSSSSDSSINSTASGRDIQGASKSQGRKMTDSNKPVGVVPVGTYEVLTLAPTQSPESKKPPNIPRLNSFKKEAKAAPPRRRKTYSQEEVSEEGASSNRSSSIDTSSDSGMHSHSTGVIQESTYDIMTGSPRPLESNFYDPIPSPTVKSPRIFPTNAPPPFEAELREKQAQQHNGIVKPGNYADIDLSRSDIKPPIDSPPKDRGHTISYTEVYVADNETTTSSGNGPLYQSEARQIPQGTNKKLEFRESYENMNLTEELISKFGRAPEGRSSHNSATKSQEYEDMRAQSISPSSEPFPSPPALPLKSPPPAIQPLPEELPPSPPKKIESRFMPRRPECYENVQPRQIIPIHTQNPFEKNSTPPQQEPPFPTIPPPSYNPKTLPAYPEYENYRAPGPAMPLYRSNTYENYRPVNEPPQPQITRSQTVSERPVSSNRPVPLPPKMNRKSVQDSSAPASPCPADSVKTPFLSQLDMDSLNEDEKELLSWLIELKLPQYFQNFQAQGFDMVSVRGVTPEDLTEIEITKAGHRKKLLSEITKLGPSNKLPTHKPEDIGAWLSLVGLRIYEENFVEGGFDEMDFIKDLDQSDLQMIEIKKKGHQKKLLLAVQRLSDVELTAELDRVVEVTALPTTSTATQEPKQDLSTTQSNDVRAPDPPQKASKQPPPDAIHRNEVQSQPEQLPSEFPPPLPPQFPPQPHQQHPPQFNPQHPPQNIQQAHPVPPLQPPVPPKPRVSQPIPQSFPQPPLFPPPPPSSELESHFLCNRDNLPPPSGKESTPLEPIAPTPPRAPIRVTADINQASNSSQPSIRPRTTSVPVAPKPKPKPRPGQNMGQVRTASEYHATDSPSKAVIMPAPVTPQKPTVPPKGDENESVTAARSRDFWQQGHQQQQQPPTTSATNTPVRTKSISGIKPIVSPRPSQKPTAPQTQRPVNQNAEPSVQPGHEISSQRISHSPSVKKVPPPAPPRRDSMPHKKDVPAPQPSQNNDVNAVERSRTFSGPLDEKIRDVFRSKGGTHTLEQAPIIEQTQEEFPQPPPSVKAKADEDFEATDMIMADIDDMIADFTNQLDSMF